MYILHGSSRYGKKLIKVDIAVNELDKLSICRICKCPIGNELPYLESDNTSWYTDDYRGLVHWSCKNAPEKLKSKK